MSSSGKFFEIKMRSAKSSSPMTVRRRVSINLASEKVRSDKKKTNRASAKKNDQKYIIFFTASKRARPVCRRSALELFHDA